VHIITQTKLRVFAKSHPDAEEPLRVWETLMRSRKFKNPHEVKSVFSGVDFIGQNKTVFDFGGNKYRLVTKMMYKWGKVLVRDVYTHKEYDRLCALGLL
jgi:mRNA interferase HigB